MPTAVATPRRPDIDALRIGACLTQFVYHTAKVFDTDPAYHVKNDVLSSTVSAITTFTHLWRMPLFFLLAGWAAAMALRHRDPTAFRRERVRRLGPPFVLGVVLLCPPIKYVERLGGIDIRPSGYYPGEPFALGFFEFLPRFFGNIREFSWSHLWFLAYLLAFSLVLAPVVRRLAAVASRRWLAYVPLGLLVLLETTLRPLWGDLPNLYGDWASMAVYLTYFLVGVLLAGKAPIDALAVECPRLGLLALGGLGLLALADDAILRHAAAAVAGWGTVGFLVGAARRWWRHDGPAVRYLAEATLPLYVLHHTPSVLLAFGIVTLPLGVPVKMGLLLVLSVLTTFALYHACVRPWPAMRLALGMRPIPWPVPAAWPTASREEALGAGPVASLADWASGALGRVTGRRGAGTSPPPASLPARRSARRGRRDRPGLPGWATGGLGGGIAVGFLVAFRGSGAFGDEGSVCTIAQEILNGRLPYRDYFNEKAPLQYLWTALVMWLSTDGIPGARIASTLTLGCTLTLALGRVARQTGSPGATLLWALVTALAGVMTNAYNNTTESTLAMLWVGSAVLVLDGRPARPGLRWLAVGCLQGLACGTRQTAIVPAAVLLVGAGHRAPRLWYLAGLVLGIAAWAGVLWRLGIAAETLDATVLFHRGNPALGSYFQGPAEADYPALLVWLLLLLGGILVARTRPGEAWVLAWAVSAALPFFGRMDAFRLWPSVILMLTYLPGRLDLREGARALIPVLVAAAAGLRGLSGPIDFSRLEDMRTRVDRYVAVEDSIWVGPFEPNVYCMTRRRSASRYYFILPWLTKPGVPEALLDDLERNRPKLILHVANPELPTHQLVPGLDALLAARYTLVEEVGNAQYFLLREARNADYRLRHAAAPSRPSLPERSAPMNARRGLGVAGAAR